MKRFVPLKYLFGMIILFIVAPISTTLLLISLTGWTELTITITIFMAALVIVGPIVYHQNQENASVVIHNNMITNYINDGTRNFGWTEDICKVRKAEIVDLAHVRQYYKNCTSKKVLFIDFGSNNVKYISVSLFTNNQINKILKHLKN